MCITPCNTNHHPDDFALSLTYLELIHVNTEGNVLFIFL